MKKKIIIISVVLIGFFLAVSANSWAQRERGGDRRVDRSGDFQNGDRSAVHKFNQDRGGSFQKWDKPAVRKFKRDRGRAYQPKRIVQHTGPSTNITGGIIIAYRRASGPNSVPGAIDRSTAVAIQDTSSGVIFIRWYRKRTTITAAPKVMLHRKTSFKLPPLFRTAVSRSLSG
jgi:hypothetical protein